MSLEYLEKVLAGATAEPLSATSIKCSQVIVQAKRANGGLCTVGTSAVVATKGYEIMKPVANLFSPEFRIEAEGGNAIDLSLIYLIGTQGDGVNILYEIY